MPPYKIQLIFLIGRTGQDQVAQMITWLGGKDGTNCMSQGWCKFTPLSSRIVAGWGKYFWRSLAPPHGGSSSKSEISLRFPNYLRKVTLLKTNLVWLNCQHWKCTIYIQFQSSSMRQVWLSKNKFWLNYWKAWTGIFGCLQIVCFCLWLLPRRCDSHSCHQH